MRGFCLKFPLICRSARSAHWVVPHYDRFLNDSIAESVGNIWFLALLIHDDWPHRGWYCITDEWFFMVARFVKKFTLVPQLGLIGTKTRLNSVRMKSSKPLQPTIAMMIWASNIHGDRLFSTSNNESFVGESPYVNFTNIPTSSQRERKSQSRRRRDAQSTRCLVQQKRRKSRCKGSSFGVCLKKSCRPLFSRFRWWFER